MSSNPPSHRRQSWEHLLEKDPHGGTRFGLGVAAAVAIHAAVFAVTWPTVAQPPPAVSDEEYIPFPITNVTPSPREPEPVLPDLPPPPPVEGPPIVSTPESAPEPIARPPAGPAVPVDHLVGPPPAPVDLPPPVAEVPDGPVVVGVDIEPPRIVERVEPRYNEAARRGRVQGVVILELIIGTDGAVESTEVLRGLPLGLTRNAVEAVEQWRFEPSTFRGHPVRVRYILTVRFTLT